MLLASNPSKKNPKQQKTNKYFLFDKKVEGKEEKQDEKKLYMYIKVDC